MPAGVQFPPGIQLVAGMNIPPATVLSFLNTPGVGLTWQICSGQMQAYGVSYDTTQYAVGMPGYNSQIHAVSGYQVQSYPATSECPIVAGGTFTAGQQLTTNANGQVVHSTGGTFNWVATAIDQSFASGQTPRCLFLPSGAGATYSA